MIKGYPEGSDITILNTIYEHPKFDEGSNEWKKDRITIIYIDNDTGRKHCTTIVNPPYEFYIAKKDVEINHNLFFIDKNDVDLVTVPYRDVTKEIAKRTNNTEFYYRNIEDGKRSANKLLHTHERVFRSDLNISDFYRYKFSRLYKNTIPAKLNKAFLDIEVDGIQAAGDFPEMGEVPINAVSLICDATKTIFSFILRDQNNPLIQEFENEVNAGRHREELYEFIKTSVGPDNASKLGMDNLRVEYLFYDEEINLIIDIFTIINHEQPDFLLAWNMAFDIPYIINRILALGYSPEDIMCHPDFKSKVVSYLIDERNLASPEERGDIADISSYTVYVDQLIQFASRRKGQGAYPSFKLDDIGNIVAKVRKLDYKHITTNLLKLPTLDFKTFIYYNIFDTVVQWCIEAWTNDVEYLFSKCVANNTRYSRCHRQTVYLANRAVIEFEDQGYIIGNNINKGNDKPTEKFPGAFVADPLKTSDYAKVKIDGHPVNIYNNLDDFDYARLYPSVLMENNMAPNTQIAKIFINNTVWENEDRFHNKYFNRGGYYVEDFSSGSVIEFAYRWHHFPTYEQLYDDTKEYFAKEENPYLPLDLVNMVSGKIKAMTIYDKPIKPMAIHTGLIPTMQIIRKVDLDPVSDFIYEGAKEVTVIAYPVLIAIYNYMKLLKSDIAVICEDGYIYGVDEEDNFTGIIYEIQTEFIGYNFMCNVKHLGNFIKEITPSSSNSGYTDLVNIIIDNENNTIKYESFDANDQTLYPLYTGVLSIMYVYDIIKYVHSKCTGTPSLRVDDLKSNEDFNAVLANKSKDGAIPFVIDKYFMHIVPSNLLINKADKVSMEIYQDFNNIFIAKIDVLKKSGHITIYLKYLNLI